MDFYVMGKSYNCYGGHPVLSEVGDILIAEAPGFGDAIREFTLTIFMPCSGRPKKALGSLFEQHKKLRATLPTITFRRKKKAVEIAMASDLFDGCDWDSPAVSASIIKQAVAEIIEALGLLRKRIKPSDDFDLDGFLAHCEAAAKRVPGSEAELEQLSAEFRKKRALKFDAMSPWEKLGIDWDDFHPIAREILDDPIYWSRADDFAPNGNDTGADLLEAYRDWIKIYPTSRPLLFLARLARQWGYSSFEGMDARVRDEAAVGLAFADIKLRGECDSEARRLALEALERQHSKAEQSTDWPHRDDRLQTVEILKRKLAEIAL